MSFIDLAGEFYAQFPAVIPVSNTRNSTIARLAKTLQNSVFLSAKKKEKLTKTLPFFCNQTLEELQEMLLRQNFRYLIHNICSHRKNSVK